MNEATVDVNESGTDTLSSHSKGNHDSLEATRLGYLVPALLILMLAGIVTYISYTQEPADAFLFPRLISSVMIVLALWNFIRAASGKSKVGQGVTFRIWLRIIPGILLMAVFIFFAAKYFGFYVASSAAFFLMYSGYDPASHLSINSWLRRIVVTAVFMSIIYALFTLLLKVQTPRGLYL